MVLPMTQLGEKTLIVVPTYNERANLESFLATLRAAAPAAHVLVVDDNSPDGTGALAEQMAERDPHVSVLRRPGKLGLGTAYVDGFRRGLAGGYSRFFEMDADFSHDPRYLAAFSAALDAGADVVLGSRNIPGGAIEGWGFIRHFFSKGGSFYARQILGLHVRDLTTGFKAFSRHALETIGLEGVHSNGYSFQIEMTYRAVLAGLAVVEVPIVFVDRRAGQSKMDRRVFVEAIAVVWRLRFEALRRRL